MSDAIAKVVVNLALNREFDYRIPERLRGRVRVGSQVRVPFGRGERQGHVIGLAASSPHAGLKEIADLAGDQPLISEPLLALARWVADYYLAPIELAVQAVLPAPVRRKSAAFKKQQAVELALPGQDPQAAELLRKRAPNQAAALDFLRERGSALVSEIAAATGVTAPSLRALAQAGMVTLSLRTLRRDPFGVHGVILPTLPLPLMEQQAAALARIVQAMETLKPAVVLLHGVTGSGKTEVYLQAIRQALEHGKGAIVLVPEVALTPQMIERFRGRFGDVVAILHSYLSEGERHDEWHRIHAGTARIAIGPRSAVFAPVRNLGLIVVDEEHESTYKQEEAPRYNARDVAVMRGRLERCAVVLGSATPALESIHNAQGGKYELVKLLHRVDHRRMPFMRVVDMRIEAEREGKPHVISRDLAEAIRLRLDRAEQTILFLNRRGYASSLVCPKCGYTAQCAECSVALTYHKTTHELICHYCGARRAVPDRCPNPECRDPAFKYAGLGTQRLEQILGQVFPKARLRRMDADSTTGKDAHRSILADFRSGKIDILLGTQMIAKGLDFPNVTLVGIVFADLSLHLPDFRAAERTFQLLTQVAGRAGRGDVAGEVFIQTYTPFHPAIQAAQRMDFDNFYDQEAEYRRELSYPPYGRLVCLTLSGVKEDEVIAASEAFLKDLQPRLGPEVIVPEHFTPAPIARIRNQFRYQLLLRAPQVRQIAAPLRLTLEAVRLPEGLRCAVDVDAQHLL